MADDDVDGAFENIIARSVELYDDGKYEEVLKKYEEASTLDPQQGLSWYMKGMTLLKLGRFGEALMAFDMASKLDPDIIEPLIGKAFTLFKLFRFDDAINTFKTIFVRKMSTDIAFMIGLCYLINENMEQAEVWMKKAIAVSYTHLTLPTKA